MQKEQTPEPTGVGKGAASQLNRLLIIVVAIAVVIAFGVWFQRNSRSDVTLSSDTSSEEGGDASVRNVPNTLQSNFTTDFSKASLTDFTSVVSGGPGKDGIPAVDNPQFEPISQTTIAETTRGVLVEIGGEARFYPYNILVWHEIVNDEIGGVPVSVTFCPLCGSAIVYDRRVDDQILEFGVSGFLRESNMIMFDRQTETLWQQSTGEAFAGEFNGTELELVEFQLLELFTAQQQFPDAVIMTTETGAIRDYSVYPYGNYDNNEQLFFDVSVNDNRFPTKELFYAVKVDDTPIALRVGELEDNQPVSFTEGGFNLVAEKSDGLVSIRSGETNEVIPGYYEMWFSWATWHQNDGVVWQQ